MRTETGSLPGYYWLAATGRTCCLVVTTAIKIFRVNPDGSRYKSWKGTWFPLEDETARASCEGEETRERPLLLHPYCDEPADHLEFLDEGVVRARIGANGQPSRRGEETIDIFGLNRYGLPNARQFLLIRVKGALEDVLKAQREWLAHPDKDSAANHRQCIADLEQLLKPPQGYFAATGQVLGLTGPQAQQSGGASQGTAAATAPPAAKYRKAANTGTIQSSQDT